MNRSNYFEAEGINWSTLKYMKKSPLDYLVRKQTQVEESDYMRLGSMVDCGLLTPDEFKETYVKAPPVSWKSKADKEATANAYAEALNNPEIVNLSGLKKDEFLAVIAELSRERGKVLVPAQANPSDVFTWERGIAIITQNHDKPVFRKVMNNIEKTQLALFAECEVTGLKLKGLADIITKNAIVDLKTIGTLGKIYYNIRALDYLGQLAYYDYLAELNGVKKESHWFIFIETCSPYKMRLVEVDPRVIAKEREANLELLKKLKHCMDTGEFTDGSEHPELYEYREADNGQVPDEEEWLKRTEEPGQDSLQ